MGFDYTTDNLIASIKRRGSIPTSQSLFRDDDFLALADEELQNVVVPMILSLKADYFVNRLDYTMTQETSYDIPHNAIGVKIKDVFYVDDSGREAELVWLDPIDTVNNWNGFNQYTGFFVQENSLIIYPATRPGQILRVKFFKRPNKLVETSQSGQIESIDTNTNQVTLTNVPTEWEVGDFLCDIEGRPGFRTMASNLEIIGVSSPIVELDDVSDLSVGDWLAFEDESPIPQVPYEAHAILAQSVIVKCLEALGDFNGMKLAQAKYDQINQNFINMITPRVDAQAKKITNKTGIHFWSSVRKGYPW